MRARRCTADWIIWRHCRLLDIGGMKNKSEKVVRKEQEVKLNVGLAKSLIMGNV